MKGDGAFLIVFTVLLLVVSSGLSSFNSFSANVVSGELDGGSSSNSSGGGASFAAGAGSGSFVVSASSGGGSLGSFRKGYFGADDFYKYHNLSDYTLVLYNKNDLDSFDIAKYYASKRGIDERQLCGVRLPVGKYSHYKYFLGARNTIIEDCICKLINESVPSTMCNSSNLDEIVQYSNITHLAIMRGIPTRLFGTKWEVKRRQDSMNPSFDYFLARLIYTNNTETAEFPYSKLSYYNGGDDGVQRIDVRSKRIMGYGRIEAMNKERTYDLIDRTILAEQNGFWGNFISGSFSGYTRFFNRLTNTSCGYKSDGNYSGCDAWLSNGQIPGEKTSNIKRVYNAGIFLNNNYGGISQAGFDGFFNMLNWRETSEPCITLCKDTSNSTVCRLDSTDYFKEINTACVGVADGFLGFQRRSYPVGYMGFWPNGWRSPPSGAGNSIPPQVLSGSSFINEKFTDDKFLRFGNVNEIEDPYCYLNDKTNESCSEAVTPYMHSWLGIGGMRNITTSENNYTLRFRVRYPEQTVPKNLSVTFYARNLAGTYIRLNNSRLLFEIKGSSLDWKLFESNLSITTEKLGSENYSAIRLVLSSNNLNKPFDGYLDLDGIEFFRTDDDYQVVIPEKGSFNAGFFQTTTGDWAGNVIERLGGVAFWGSSSHFRTGGFAFNNARRFVERFFGGRSLGESLMSLGTSPQSGIIYGDPLYQPMAIKVYHGNGTFVGGFGENRFKYLLDNNLESLNITVNAFNGVSNLDTVSWNLSFCDLTPIPGNPPESLGVCASDSGWGVLYQGFGGVYNQSISFSKEELSQYLDYGEFKTRLRVFVDSEYGSNEYFDYTTFIDFTSPSCDSDSDGVFSSRCEGTDCNDNDDSVWKSGYLYLDSDSDGLPPPFILDGNLVEGKSFCYGENLPEGYFDSLDLGCSQRINSTHTNVTLCNIDCDDTIQSTKVYTYFIDESGIFEFNGCVEKVETDDDKCTDVYSSWGGCQSDGFRYRVNLSQLPENCDGGIPLLRETCDYQLCVPGQPVLCDSIPHADVIGYKDTCNSDGKGYSGINTCTYICNTGYKKFFDRCISEEDDLFYKSTLNESDLELGEEIDGKKLVMRVGGGPSGGPRSWINRARNPIISIEGSAPNFTISGISILRSNLSDPLEYIIVTNLTLGAATKTIYLEKKNIESNGVCIRDSESDTVAELELDCVQYACSSDNNSVCFEENNTFIISGLSHSGVVEVSLSCGDGVCLGSESCLSCVPDCGVCPALDTSPGGSPGGGSRTRTDPVVVIPEEENEHEVIEEYGDVFLGTNSVQNLSRFKQIFSFNDENHTVRVLYYDEEKILLEIRSNPIIVEVFRNETKDIDIDGDGDNDVSFTYNGVVNGDARLVVEVIDRGSGKWLVLLYIVIFVFVVVIIVLFYFYSLKRRRAFAKFVHDEKKVLVKEKRHLLNHGKAPFAKKI